MAKRIDLLSAEGLDLNVNAGGQITGYGVTSTGELHAFLATPVSD